MAEAAYVLSGPAAEKADMRIHRLEGREAKEEMLSIPLDEAGAVLLETQEGRPIGVLLALEEHQLLQAAAALASEPERLLELVEENRRFQEGDEGEVLTPEEVEDILR